LLKKRGIFLAGMLLILLFCFLLVRQRMISLNYAEKIAEREKRVRIIEKKCRTLELEVAELSSMQRIEKIAKDKFSLSPVLEGQLVNAESLSGAKPREDKNKELQPDKSLLKENNAFAEEGQ